MALADPQTVTVNAVAKTLNRIKVDGSSSEYTTADGEYRFRVSHQDAGKGRARRMVRVDKRIVAADPLSAVNEYKALGVYLVVDEPNFGFDDTSIWQVTAGLIGWLTQANVEKVLASQH